MLCSDESLTRFDARSTPHGRTRTRRSHPCEPCFATKSGVVFQQKVPLRASGLSCSGLQGEHIHAEIHNGVLRLSGTRSGKVSQGVLDLLQDLPIERVNAEYLPALVSDPSKCPPLRVRGSR